MKDETDSLRFFLDFIMIFHTYFIFLLTIVNLCSKNIYVMACMGTSSQNVDTTIGTSEESTTIEYSCSEHEKWSDCVCEKSCEDPNLNCQHSYGHYSHHCKPGCQCRHGYVRGARENGWCVPIDHCIGETVEKVIVYKQPESPPPPPVRPSCGDSYCPPEHICKNFCSKSYSYENCEQKCVREDHKPISCEEIWCPDSHVCKLVCQDYNYYKFNCIPKCVLIPTTSPSTTTTSSTSTSTTSTTSTTTTTTSTTTTTTGGHFRFFDARQNFGGRNCLLACPTLCQTNGCRDGVCEPDGQSCHCNQCLETSSVCDTATCSATCTGINCPFGQCSIWENHCECRRCFDLNSFNDFPKRRASHVIASYQHDECLCPINTANLFVAQGTPILLDDERSGIAASCTTCSPNGIQRCLNANGNRFSPDYFPETSAAGISIPFCEKFCACTSDGVCYQPVNQVDTFRIAPFCANGKCCNNIFFVSTDGDAGLMSEDGSEMFTMTGQRDSKTENYLPFTCDNSISYPEIVSIGCNGCDQIREAICTGNPER